MKRKEGEEKVFSLEQCEIVTSKRMICIVILHTCTKSGILTQLLSCIMCENRQQRHLCGAYDDGIVVIIVCIFRFSQILRQKRNSSSSSPPPPKRTLVSLREWLVLNTSRTKEKVSTHITCISCQREPSYMLYCVYIFCFFPRSLPSIFLVSCFCCFYCCLPFHKLQSCMQFSPMWCLSVCTIRLLAFITVVWLSV